MSIKSLFAAAVVTLAVVGTSAANAYFSGSSTFQGVTFVIAQTSSTKFTFEIKDAVTASGSAAAVCGDWCGIKALAGFDFKDLGISNFGAGASATETYSGGGSDVGSNHQLSGTQLCTTPGSPGASICFAGATDLFPGLNLGLTNDMLFTIDITGATLDIAATGPHLQIAFMDTLGCTESKGPPPVHCKAGSLYSQNIASSSGPSSSGPSSSGPSIPEPATLALLGVGFAGLAATRRRRLNDTH